MNAKIIVYFLYQCLLHTCEAAFKSSEVYTNDDGGLCFKQLNGTAGEFSCINSEVVFNYNWEQFPPSLVNYFESAGWTKDAWNWDYEENSPYELFWDSLISQHKKALMVFGWIKESWDIYIDTGSVPYENTPTDCTKIWNELTSTEKTAAYDLGWDSTTWHRVVPLEDVQFNPEKINLSIPTLNKYSFDYLQDMDIDVDVCEGSAKKDDEFSEYYITTMKQFVQDVKKGSTKFYLKYEDKMKHQDLLQEEIGDVVMKELKSAVKAKGIFRPEWELESSSWSFWVGANGTSTPLHIDDDSFNFLWVLEGRKRVVLIPNEGQFECKTFIPNHSCWPKLDVFNDELPSNAVVIELGPGEGIEIPYQAWHAVKNEDATIAFGFRIDDGGKL